MIDLAECESKMAILEQFKAMYMKMDLTTEREMQCQGKLFKHLTNHLIELRRQRKVCMSSEV